MIPMKSFAAFFLILTILYALFFTSPVALAQEASDDTFTTDASTESVTSTYDAGLKAMLIISQVALIGLIFNHLILQRDLHNNKKAQENSVGQFISTFLYHTSGKLVVFLLICCISIIVFSSAIMLLSSYELAQNLELDVSSAFWIIYSTSVGDVWMLRIVTSFVIIGILISYHIKIRRQINKKKKLNQGQDQVKDKIVFSLW